MSHKHRMQVDLLEVDELFALKFACSAGSKAARHHQNLHHI